MTPYQIEPGHARAQDFDASATFFRIRVNCPSWSNNIGNLTLTLYHVTYSGDRSFSYAATVASAPVAQKTFVNYADNQWLSMDFERQPPGRYLWVLSGAEEVVGVWGSTSSTYRGTAYVDGIPSTSFDYLSEIVMSSNDPSAEMPLPPAWTNTAVFYGMRLDRFNPPSTDGTRPGTFEDAILKLDHLAKLGVTAIILNPVNLPNRGTNGYRATDIYYGVKEHEVIDPALSRGPDVDQAFRSFVGAAHALGIKVVLDVVPHGVYPSGSVLQRFPLGDERDDYPRANFFWEFFPQNCPPPPGQSCNYYAGPWDGMYEFDFTNPEIVGFWVGAMTSLVSRFDIDGFRCDLEPNEAGPVVWAKVANRVKDVLGKDILIMAEGPWMTEVRKNLAGGPNGFHLSEYDAGVRSPHRDYPGFIDPDTNLVSYLRGRTGLFYTSTLSSTNGGLIGNDCAHPDCLAYNARGRLVYFGYGMALAPMLPNFFMGEEMNMPYPPGGVGANAPILYFTTMNWAAGDSAFLARVQKLFQIRAANRDIIAPFEELRATGRSLGSWATERMVQLQAVGAPPELPPYAMVGSRGVVVVVGMKGGSGVPVIDLSPLFARQDQANVLSYSVVDLMTDRSVATITAASPYLNAAVQPYDVGAYLLTPSAQATHRLATFSGTVDTPYQIAPGHTRGQDFASPFPFSRLRVNCPSWSNNVGNLTLTLYHSAPSYQYADTIQTPPIASRTFENYQDNAWLTVDFAEQPPGHYLWVLSNAQEMVGVWGAASSTFGGSSFIDGAPAGTLDYVSEVVGP